MFLCIDYWNSTGGFVVEIKGDYQDWVYHTFGLQIKLKRRILGVDYLTLASITLHYHETVN
jgi:hypothetical protein